MSFRFPCIFALVTLSVSAPAIAETCLPQTDAAWPLNEYDDPFYVEFEIDENGALHFPGPTDYLHPFARLGMFQEGDRLTAVPGVDLLAIDNPVELHHVICDWRRSLTGGVVMVLRNGNLVEVELSVHTVAADWDRILGALYAELNRSLAHLSFAVFRNSPLPVEGLGIMFRRDQPYIRWRDEDYVCRDKQPGCIWDVATPPYPSPARDAGIRRGDVIMGIDEVGFMGLDEEVAAHEIDDHIRSRTGPFDIYILRGERELRFTVAKAAIVSELDAAVVFANLQAAIKRLEKMATRNMALFGGAVYPLQNCGEACAEAQQYAATTLPERLQDHQEIADEIRVLQNALLPALDPLEDCLFEFGSMTGYHRFCDRFAERWQRSAE